MAIEVERRANVYEKFGLTPVLNVAGTHTKLGGPLMNQDAARAMLDAAYEAVPIDQLQAHASRVIAEITGAEAGYVTSGAAAGLTLATAACICGLDVGKMNLLPSMDGAPPEVVISREHRSGYDHSFRAAGVRLVEVGMNEITAGAGVRRTEPWEYAAALSERTVAVAYVYNPTSAPKLESVAEVCRDEGVPLIVDAAGQVPPIANLTRLPASGASAVVFSGGKGIRGPQGTGIVAGKHDLIMSIALQQLDLDEHWDLWTPPGSLIDKTRLHGLPRHGFGRGFKVSKEEIVGLIVALKQFASGGDENRLIEAERFLRRISASLAALPGIKANISAPSDTYATLDILIGKSARVSALEACRALRASPTPVYVGEKRLDEGVLTINPISLDDEKTEYLIERLQEVFAP